MRRAQGCVLSVQPELQKELEARGESTVGSKPTLYQRLRDVMVQERVEMLDDAEAAAAGRSGPSADDGPAEIYIPTEAERELLETHLPSDLYKLSMNMVRLNLCTSPQAIHECLGDVSIGGCILREGQC